MDTILEVRNLSKSFEQTQVLQDISFAVTEGEFIAIMGPSGSGKSTLLYSISGMDRPSSGDVLLHGKDIAKLDDKSISEIRLKQMGFVFQQSYLLKNLSIRDNIVLPGFKAGTSSRGQVNGQADRLMKKTGIYPVASHDIQQVSGGEMQRAAICRALINKPAILFGDEPTGALNSSTTKEVMDILNRVNEEGTTVIIVTHDAKVASRASRVIYLLDGSIHAELNLGPYEGEEMTKTPRQEVLAEWLQQQGF
ncbi:ABC transporter ATP-binding protein [Sphaerochaeta sp. PS]|uniref:ABC transporter ATP-binding protein n=1 Tax=Sphaerochaeta sp. PS TaxID=3076336 RepID=UPI0028A4EB7C|nr:ABC transporter ATP-binding protein [Sphaerochaeta sp. PS]MDT4761790.1 ABC transporter ATP-binding protein [Sphaerochaeta sp. PS]